MNANVIATKNFTTSGPPVTMVGLGGEGILRTHRRDARAREVIKTAVKQGITYFDCARVYADSEVYYGSLWREHPKRRSGIFQASKSARRDKDGALADTGRNFKPLSEEERSQLLNVFEPHAKRLAYYRGVL